MKTKIFLLVLFFSPIVAFTQIKTLHDFKVQTIEGTTLDFSTLKGKKVLLVNTASKCSLAGQMFKLQELYEEYGGDEFEIIAFPSNDFGNREPGTNEEIAEHYQQKYGISFPVMQKISVKGEEAHPVYQWLKTAKKNGTLDGIVQWNFQKFMIDENGLATDYVSPIGSPAKDRIIEWLQEGL